MPPRDSPVETQLAQPVPEGLQSRSRGSYSRPVGSRNLLLIPNVRNVLGIDRNCHGNTQISERKIQSGIDRNGSGNAHITGKKIQSGLDLCKKTDVQKRNLREARSKLQSSPINRVLPNSCSLMKKDTETGKGNAHHFEVVGSLRCCQKMKSIIKEIVQGIEHGIEPVSVTGGMGGAYYFRNTRGENVAIVKPNDEEPFAPNNPKGFVGKSLGELGLNRGVRVGETGVREVAAYLLDHKHFARVPPTALVKVSHHAFHSNVGVSGSDNKSFLLVEKIASCQQFVRHDFDASDHGSSRFSVSAVHRIGILDIRIFNTDRHAGNILVQRGKADDNFSNVVNEALDLIPIDHGLCLPESLGDPYFEWLHWPQSSLPFSEEELAYIQVLDEYKDAEMLRQELPTLREACLRVLMLSTLVLKRGAEDGLCLAEIGEMMSRDGIGGASQLELICMQAKEVMESLKDYGDDDDDAILVHSEEGMYEQFEFEMDEDEDEDSVFSAVIEGDEESSPSLSRKAIPGGRYCPESSVNGPKPAFVGGGEFDMLKLPDCRPAIKPFSVVRASEAINGLSRLGMMSPRNNVKGQHSPMTRSEFHPLVMSEFQPLVEEEEELHPLVEEKQELHSLVEEEEMNVFETKPKDWLTKCKMSASSPKSRSYKSISFIHRNQGYMDYHHEHKVPPSEAIGKANVPPAFSLGDMSDKEWNCFLDNFKELLEEALVVKSNQNVGHRQRLGISCQF